MADPNYFTKNTRNPLNPTGLEFSREGAASKQRKARDQGHIGTAVMSQKLVKIRWEDDTESHVTPEHAASIRKQAAGLRQPSPRDH